MLSLEATTRLLKGVQLGEPGAREALLEALYGELRALAGSMFRGQASDHTLQPTALVHEAWVRLADRTSLQVNDRAHFMSIAATAMRQILVDHARARSAQKRGGPERRVVSLDDVEALAGGAPPDEMIAIDECVRRLSDVDPRQGRVLEMRVFAGMTVEEVAQVLGVSPRTVELDWRMARAWLSRELSHADA
ncbi:MAG: sigma-70 family RNA polymerase sigma factor [Phycisphaerales bacterium]